MRKNRTVIEMDTDTARRLDRLARQAKQGRPETARRLLAFFLAQGVPTPQSRGR